ncbi:Exostosin family protein [Abeliophyllum distichum]|uniref:Exostosin family protein n=1 Tax=Abeliophyllum distichum TaxID=126358 RepID=A0ABD1REK6_9LAMI
MDHSIPARSRKKIWLGFFILFVSWYLLLYLIDWSPLPGFASVSHHQPNSVVYLGSDYSQNVSLMSHVNDTSKNATVYAEKEEKSVKISSTEFEGLRNELEPKVQQDDDKYAEKDQEKRAKSGRKSNSCTGRYIYVHDLPSKFNNDLLKQCKLLNKWTDMCQYFLNMGLGPALGNPQRMFLSKGWFVTDQFSLEVIFHNRMKQYECLTNDSTRATAIYVPYYAGLDIARHLWDSHNISVRDSDALDLVKWLREKPEWNAMGGMDHFLVAGRITWDFRRVIDEDNAWGNKLMLLSESQNMTILTIESSPWNKNDFGIPYPTYFHPSSDDQVFQWQNKMRQQKRRTLFTFAGAPRPNIEDSIRSEIMEQCTASRRKCRLLECKNGRNKCIKPVHIMKMFQNSIFCLQPPGDSFTRRSTFDSILAGCIPVFFSPASAYVQYLWNLPTDYTTYSILIPEDDVKQKNVRIEHVLSRIPRKKVSEMREEVIKLIPKVIYADPRARLKTVEDAFDLTIKGVLERVEKLRREIREGRNSSIDFDQENSWKYYTFGTTQEHEWDHFFLRTNRARY